MVDKPFIVVVVVEQDRGEWTEVDKCQKWIE